MSEASKSERRAFDAHEDVASAGRVSGAADDAVGDDAVPESAVFEAPDIEVPNDSPAPAGAQDLSTWTVAQLRARARLEGRVGYAQLTKAQLIEMLG